LDFEEYEDLEETELIQEKKQVDEPPVDTEKEAANGPNF
jgi:hypothetical protein